MGGLLQRAEPRPHRQGGTPCVRGVLLRECQEQLRDAELRRMSYFLICGGIIDFLTYSRLSGVGACSCTDLFTDVQSSAQMPLKLARRAVFDSSEMFGQCRLSFLDGVLCVCAQPRSTSAAATTTAGPLGVVVGYVRD